MNNGMELLVSDHHGVYVPQVFAQQAMLDQWGISPDDADILLAGPDHKQYWDAWDDVLSNARCTLDGKTYTLHQNGDLWAVCPELMDNEEYQNFFGEIKPAPADAYEYEVCEDCLMLLANGEYSGMESNTAPEEGMTELLNQYLRVIPDGAEYGFRHYRCECCDALPGDRFRVLCFDKVGE